jgi:hypothetical protein
MIRTPRDRHRLAFPLMAISPDARRESSTNAPRLRAARDGRMSAAAVLREAA